MSLKSSWISHNSSVRFHHAVVKTACGKHVEVRLGQQDASGRKRDWVRPRRKLFQSELQADDLVAVCKRVAGIVPSVFRAVEGHRARPAFFLSYDPGKSWSSAS